jgi:glycopeptide antibiotics resistance protein
LYSLPDGLWVYSFSATLFLIWGENFKGFKVITLIPFMFLCFIEILQHFKIVMGTFDVMDVFVAFLTYFLLIINLKLFKNETQN